MSGLPAPASPAPSRLLGALRSWLRTWPTTAGPSSEGPAFESERSAGPFGGTVRVLLVDDNPVNLMVISALMESRGLAPVLAADGAEAVALACQQQFDLIVMDLQMPVLDGLAATSAIRRFESEASRRAAPVIAYSSASPGAAVLARHGFTGSLAKPCEDQDVEDCLVRWCPDYRPTPALRGVEHGHKAWQAAARATANRGVSLG